jgi:AcrR family transcriptional regulator
MARPADPHAREALLSAAERAFAQGSLSSARIEDITAAVGLSKGAFYLHFKSKEAAFEELLQRMNADLAALDCDRAALSAAFIAERGALTARDRRSETRRYRDFVAMEVAQDEATLESIWKHRSVFSTLLRGCGGTVFENALWLMLDREQTRVVDQIRNLQGCLVTRRDVPPEVVATMIMGTYFLAGQRMVMAEHKPDLHALAVHLNRLMHEGLSPTAERADQLPSEFQKPSRKKNVVRRHP